MRTVIMAASEYGLQCIEAVKRLNDIEIVGIVTTQQDYILKYGKEKEKKMHNPIYSVLQEKCLEWGIPIYVIDKMNDSKSTFALQEWRPEVSIISGWYHLVGDKILSIPSKGVIGLHSSLLPKYRGGAPLVWQLINGEKKTGITLFYMSNKVDAGDIIAQKEVIIQDDDTIKTLYEKVGKKGIELLQENLPLIKQNCASRIKQEHLSDSDIYPQRTPMDGLINWDQDTNKIYDFIRAQTKPYPGAYTMMDAKVVKIWSSESCTVVESGHKPSGTIIGVDKVGGKEIPIIATASIDTALKLLDYSCEDDKNVQWKLGYCL